MHHVSSRACPNQTPMVHRSLALAAVLLAASCDGASEPVVAEPPRPTLSFTHWAQTTELFAELPALVSGATSPMAAHVTRLTDFMPLTTGTLTVTLAAPGIEERFTVDEVVRAGIFRPELRPTSAGSRHLVVEVVDGALHSLHDLGEVVVYATDAEAVAAAQDEPASGRIVLLKEQQWAMPFATELATVRALRPSISVFGTIEARPEGDVTVRAPTNGRMAADGVASLGDEVERNTVLSSLLQRLDTADRSSLELARTTARMDLTQAEREHERVSALFEAGAVSERRAVDAAHVVSEARAALVTAERQLSLFERALRTGGSRSGALPIRSPIDGEVLAVEAAPGALVETGDPLFRIVAPGSVWLSLQVPETDVLHLGRSLGAAYRVAGDELEREVPSSALISRSVVIDPVSRASTVRFALLGTPPLGASVTARLFTDAPESAVAIPWAAVLDDGGVWVAFVQVEGEAFERRAVRLGRRDGDWIGILAGVLAGERVVTTGALAVRLAGASGVVPAHGHSH